jgi:hypothetical protein
MFSHIEEDKIYFDRPCLSDKVTFHVCGTVSRHNCCVWGSENPYDVTEHEHVSPTVNVWYTLMRNKVIGLFFFLRTHGDW